MKTTHKIKHIKKGETVEIITGKYKGQTGEIIKIIHKTNSVIVKNINSKIKHIKPKQNDKQGEIISINKPIHRSNIKLQQAIQ